jgi:hypothetical protein
LIYPIVFPSHPVEAGESWRYQSEFLGGQGAEPEFTATLVAPGPGAGANTAQTQVRQDFKMMVSQDLNEEKEPVKAGETIYQTMRGRIDGEGRYRFDRARGLFTSGAVSLEARIDEEIVGKPKDPEAPRKVSSHVKAKVAVALEPSPAKGSASRQGAKKRP